MGKSARDKSATLKILYASGNTVKKERPTSRRVKVVDDDSVSPAQRKRIEKLLKAYSVESIFSITMGLPSRVRSFVKKVWKRQDRWEEDWEKIGSEMSEGASKILNQRIDVVTLFTVACEREGKSLDTERMEKMTDAKEECDALLTIYSHLFLVGASVRVSRLSVTFAGPDADFFLGGLLDVINYGQMDHATRRKRKADAHALIKRRGWPLPTREHKK